MLTMSGSETATRKVAQMLDAADVDLIRDIAIETARTEAKAVLKTMVILHARLAHDLIAKNVLTHTEYTKSLEKVVDDPVSAHDKDPLIFDAVARAAVTLFQQPLPPSEQQSG
jgi:hypothetical protein